MKYLLWLAILGVVWWVWSKRSAAGDVRPERKDDPEVERMVTCAHCGVHLPESEAVNGGGQIYCSEAHRALARQKNS